MEEEDMEIDCSLFLRMSKPANENLCSDPKPRNQRQAWVETHESKSLESELDYERIVISQEENNVEANYLRSTENFTICKKCLSNRNEFEKDNDAEKLALPGENLSSRKEICICVMGDESTDKLMNEMDCNGLLAFHSEEEHRTTIFTIFDLPDEIMLKIFSYFSRTELCRYVAPVCETWLAYARDSTLWEEITEKEFRNVATDLLVKVIISWCSLLKVLDLKGRTDIDENSLRAIFASCPLIENISLAFCDQINDQMMKLFSDNCPNLKFVNFEGCKISDSSLIYLFGKPIRGLNLSHCNMISDEGLLFIANNFDKLSSLNLDGVQWISQASIEILVNLHAQNLTEVVLDGADLTDDSIRLLSQCYNVRKFSLSFCDSLTDYSLGWIEQFKKLAYLQLKKGANFTNSAILSLLRNLRHMEGQGLKYLNLSECSSLSDKCLQALSQSCPNLFILNLSWCWEVTDDGINFILDSCHKIKELHLCGLHELYGIPFRRIQRQMPQLTFLDLRQCNKMSDDLLTDLASELKSLTILNYYGDVVKASLNYWNLESKCSPGHFHHTSI